MAPLRWIADIVNGRWASNRTTRFSMKIRSMPSATPHSLTIALPASPAASLTPKTMAPAHFEFHWQPPRPRTVNVHSRPLSRGELDDQCGPALGSLPTTAEPAGCGPALCDLALLSFGTGLFCIFSYSRVFQTPSFENILYSSSPQVTALSSNFLRLPVEPSQGNYYEVGLTKIPSRESCALTPTISAGW